VYFVQFNLVNLWVIPSLRDKEEVVLLTFWYWYLLLESKEPTSVVCLQSLINQIRVECKHPPVNTLPRRVIQ
jgi:hypothetical protein